MKKMTLTLALLSFLAISAAPAGAQETVENGKEVKMDYTLTVNGEIIDTSEGKEPLEYTQGSGQIIPGLEQQMTGMKEGEHRTITVLAEDAYGPVNPNAIQEVPRSMFPEGIDLQVGMVLPLQDSAGNVMPAKIEEIRTDTVMLNLNHPLAGQNLTFDVTVVEIQ